MPFGPYQDPQWRIVSGPADLAAVSFESVNQPGRHRRHSDDSVVLAANDNTTGSAPTPTVHRVAGLADSGWSSVRSHNFPNRHLRHQSNQLHIHEMSPTTAREDATFRVVH